MDKRIMRGEMMRYLSLLALIAAILIFTPAQADPPLTNYYHIIVSASDDTASGGTACTLRDAIGITTAGTTSGTVNGCVIQPVGTPVNKPYVLTLPIGSYTYTLVGSSLAANGASGTSAYIVGDSYQNTIIQANTNPNTATYRVLLVGPSMHVELDNLTIRHGYCNAGCGPTSSRDRHGGGILVFGSITLKGVHLTNNLAGVGGGMMTDNADALLIDTLVTNNTANYTQGGGLFHLAGLMTLQGNTIVSDNQAIGDFSSGGGIGNNNSGILILEGNTLVTNNFTDREGGGIYTSVSSARLTVRGNATITNNTAGTNGGGINNNSGWVTVQDNAQITGNSAQGQGGGIYFGFGNLTIENGATISDNISVGNGGGFYFNGFPADIANIQNSIITGNVSSGGTGGGMYFTNVNANDAVNGNCITNNSDTSVVNTDASDVLNATGNWWGTADGPGGAGTGSGDSASTQIDFSGWLISTPAVCQPPTATATNTATFTPSNTPTDTSTPTNTASETPTSIPSTDTPESPTETATPVSSTETNTPAPPTDIPTSESPTATEIAALELLINGGFEHDTDSNKIPDGWSQHNPSGDKLKCNKDQNGDGIPDKIVAFEGNCAYQFKSAPGENSKLQQTVDTTNLAANDSITLRGLVNAKGSVNTKTKVTVKYGDGSKQKITVSLNAATDGYVAFDTLTTEHELTLSAAPDNIKVQLQNKGASGKVLFDDLHLYLNAGNARLIPLP